MSAEAMRWLSRDMCLRSGMMPRHCQMHVMFCFGGYGMRGMVDMVGEGTLP
jgi:hypothetical protein